MASRGLKNQPWPPRPSRRWSKETSTLTRCCPPTTPTPAGPRIPWTSTTIPSWPRGSTLGGCLLSRDTSASIVRTYHILRININININTNISISSNHYLSSLSLSNLSSNSPSNLSNPSSSNLSSSNLSSSSPSNLSNNLNSLSSHASNPPSLRHRSCPNYRP